MDLREIDAIETVGHSFIIHDIIPMFDYYKCDVVVDGVPREIWYEPIENCHHLGYGSPEFERYICAQSLGRPPKRGE